MAPTRDMNTVYMAALLHRSTIKLKLMEYIYIFIVSQFLLPTKALTVAIRELIIVYMYARGSVSN